MLKQIKGLLSDSAIYGLSGVLQQIVGLLVLPVYTRHLSTEDYGAIGLFALLTGVFGPLGHWGIANAVFKRFYKETSEERRTKALRTALASVSVTSIALGGLCLLNAGFITVVLLGDQQYVPLVRIVVLTATLMTLGELPLRVLRAQRRVKMIAILNAINLFISVSLIVVFVAGFRWGLPGMVMGQFVGAIIVLCSFLVVVQRDLRFEFDSRIWREMFSYGWPFVPHHLFGQCMTLIGQFIIARMVGLSEAGLYHLASRFAVPIGLVVFSIQKAWVPYKFQMHAELEDSSQFFRSVMLLYVSAISLVWVIVSIWGPEILWLLAEPRFYTAGAFIPLLAFAQICRGLYFMLGTGIELTDDTRMMPLVSFAGLAGLIVTSYFLVPRFGAYGAAWGAIFGWLIMAGLISFLAQRRFPIKHDWRRVSGICVLAGAVVVLSVRLQSDLGFLARLSWDCFVTMVFPLLILLMLSRSENERAILREFWAQLGSRFLNWRLFRKASDNV